MACRAEADPSDHAHGHGHGHGHGHDHSHDDPERGEEANLYEYIDLDNLRCLNEHEDGAVKGVFRPWTERLDLSAGELKSDADEQLIVHIPFTGDVKLKGITIIGPSDNSHPTKMKIFKNRDDIDFDNADDVTPEQEWDMQPTPDGQPQYHTRITAFQNLQNITLYFPENGGAEESCINYIGLSGQCMKVNRRTIITVAEVAANPKDHNVDGTHAFGANSTMLGK